MCLTEMSRVSDVLRMPSGVALHVSAGEQLADGGWAGPRQEVVPAADGRARRPVFITVQTAGNHKGRLKG